MRRTIAAVALAVTVALAGCAGAGGPATAATTTGTQAQTTSGTGTGDGAASLAFYVSDRPGAIEDFRHLNVTITRVGLHYTGSANGSASASADGTATSTTTNATSTTNATTTVTATTESESDGDGGGYWVERDVNETTVDLTRLQGENATLLGNLSVPAGSYDKVFAYVSSVNATLESGETARVKLPSQKLQVHSTFTLNATESAHFVYDVNVVETGGGMYILKPVVSETGLGLPVQEVSAQGSAAANASASGGLSLSLPETPAVGENVTVTVTRDGSPVANATVTVNGDVVGETTADGTVTFTVENAAKLRVVAQTDDARARLVVDLDVTAGGGSGHGNSSGSDGNG